MKIAFLGTPVFAGELLRLLSKDTNLTVSYVITRPDKPVGRKKILTPSAVSHTAKELGLPVYFDLRVLKEKPVDLAILFAFGVIIPQWALLSPKHGFWNVHPSHLPHYRGASPIAFPLLLGDASSAVTLIQMDEELDHGGIIKTSFLPFSREDTRADIENKVPAIANRLILKALLELKRNGHIQAKPQNHSDATYTRLIQKNDGYIPYSLLQKALCGHNASASEYIAPLKYWYSRNSLPAPPSRDAAELVRSAYRALYGWPGLWTKVPIHGQERRLKIVALDLTKPGCCITHVQLEGKNPVPFQTFLKVYL
ncbi:MAG: formyltransferase family protein [Patescibacteria group bacterium]|nr:formyltransferase family protein [Patescibacteria group bacterium]